MHHRSNAIKRTEERGATAVEYALLIGVIALVILGGAGAFGLQVQATFDDSCSDVANSINGSSC